MKTETIEIISQTVELSLKIDNVLADEINKLKEVNNEFSLLVDKVENNKISSEVFKNDQRLRRKLFKFFINIYSLLVPKKFQKHFAAMKIFLRILEHVLNLNDSFFNEKQFLEAYRFQKKKFNLASKSLESNNKENVGEINDKFNFKKKFSTQNLIIWDNILKRSKDIVTVQDFYMLFMCDDILYENMKANLVLIYEFMVKKNKYCREGMKLEYPVYKDIVDLLDILDNNFENVNEQNKGLHYEIFEHFNYNNYNGQNELDEYNRLNRDFLISFSKNHVLKKYIYHIYLYKNIYNSYDDLKVCIIDFTILALIFNKLKKVTNENSVAVLFLRILKKIPLKCSRQNRSKISKFENLYREIYLRNKDVVNLL